MSTPSTRPPLWLWPVKLNLLAPAIACTWVAWLAACYRLYVTWPEYLALALSVWIIYTLDALLDARGAQAPASTPRRAFHAAHAGWFWLALLAAGAVLLGNCLSVIGSGLLLSGIFLAILVGMYLIHAQALRHAVATRIPKEIACGMLFAMGVGLVVMEAHGRGAVGPVSLEYGARAFSAGLLTGFVWLLTSLAFLVRSIFTENAVPLLALLFSCNCLLTARHETEDIVDTASAKHLAPFLIKLTPPLTAALGAASLVNAMHSGTSEEMRPILTSIALCSLLMLIVHTLAKLRILRGPMAVFLFDLILLLPLLPLAW